MTQETLADRFAPLLDDVIERATITDTLLDRDLYKVLVTTVWSNVVLDPDAVGIEESDLEAVHELINQQVAEVLGEDQDLRECYRYIASRPGEQAMKDARLTQNHKDLLLYFASMILDPDGHARWADKVRAEQDR